MSSFYLKMNLYQKMSTEYGNDLSYTLLNNITNYIKLTPIILMYFSFSIYNKTRHPILQ